MCGVLRAVANTALITQIVGVDSLQSSDDEEAMAFLRHHFDKLRANPLYYNSYIKVYIEIGADWFRPDRVSRMLNLAKYQPIDFENGYDPKGKGGFGGCGERE